MPITRVAVVYSIAQGRRRRVIMPEHDDSELLAHMALGRGEGLWLMPAGLYRTAQVDGRDVPAPDIDALLAVHLGRPPADDRHAVVNSTGAVVAVVRACPTCDAIDGHELKPHATAHAGGRFIDGIFHPKTDAA